MIYAGDRGAENPAYDDCPTHCDTYPGRRSDYCPSCPIGILRDQFREDTEAELAELPGEDFGFDYLHECVINALAVEQLPRHLQSVKTARMLGILDGERSRIKRVKEWNDRQAKERERERSGR